MCLYCLGIERVSPSLAIEDQGGEICSKISCRGGLIVDVGSAFLCGKECRKII